MDSPDSIDRAPGRTPGPESNTSRKYGFSCLACRRRKVRCDGRRPSCRGCSRSGADCVYQVHNASVSRLSSALSRSEARIAELQEALQRAQTPSTVPDQARLQSHETETHETHEALEAAECESTGKTTLSIDENGTVQYYGATSRFHLPLPHRLDSQHEPASKTSIDEAYHRRWLVSNARFQKSWDRAVLANLRSLTGNEISAKASSNLFQIYWTWQAPLHNCVYRRSFTRDMALGGEGPYFSSLLLNVIFAHALRHVKPGDPEFDKYEKGEVFLRRAKMLLMEEMEEEKPRIPTIQALLILGGRQCSVGKNAQGWLYTGMAIQMLKHLGFHLPKSRNNMLERLEPDDLEARKRLCLSAYAWDKSISLCLGRPPSLRDIPYPPMSLFDTSDDEEMWYPFYIESSETENTYQPTPGYITTTFLYFYEQAKIINEMFDTIYNRKSEHIDRNTVVGIENKFRSFYRSLPDQIRVDDVESLPCCPPPHIFSLNILYHTSLILLYRPFFHLATSPSHASRNDSLVDLAYRVCTEETAKVNSFFSAYGRTFRFRHQTYLTSYCVYTAATIEVQQVRHPDPEVSSQAVQRMATTLRMLEVESIQTPGIRRSVDIIKEQLDGERRGQVLHPEGPPPAEINGMRSGTTHVSAAAPIQAEASHGIVFGTGPSITQGAAEYQEELAAPLPPTDLNMELVGDGLGGTSWLDWYMLDAGGGFIPNLDN